MVLVDVVILVVILDVFVSVIVVMYNGTFPNSK